MYMELGFLLECQWHFIQFRLRRPSYKLFPTTQWKLERNAFSVIKGLLKTDGIPGLYKGFGTVVNGAIPTRIIFLTALETTKVAAIKMVEPFTFPEPSQAAIANGMADMMASLCSQAAFVPIDVGYSGNATYSGGDLDVARQIIKADRIRGLYRGFGLSVLTYSPSFAVWWASYGASKRDLEMIALNTMVPNQVKEKFCLFKLEGLLLVPLHHASQPHWTLSKLAYRYARFCSMKRDPLQSKVIKKLIADDGWTGFYRGLGPRFWGTSMILAYEYLSKVFSSNQQLYHATHDIIFYLHGHLFLKW